MRRRSLERMKGLSVTSDIPCALPEGTWSAPDVTSEGQPRVEVLDEGDGNWLVRSSFNRDRVLRLSRAEIRQLISLALSGQVQPAPELVR